MREPGPNNASIVDRSMEKRTRAFRGFALFAVLGAHIAIGADWVESRTARDVPGTQYGTYVLQVVDYEGTPVETTATLLEREPGFGGRDVTIARTTTDEGGRARFEGVSSRYPLFLEVVPPDGLRPHRQSLPPLSDAIAVLGSVRLKRNFVITGVIHQVGAEGESRPVDARTVLESSDTGRWLARNRTPEEKGLFHLEDFDDEPMTIEILRTSPRQYRTYRVPFAVDPERPRRHLVLTLPPEHSSRSSVRVEEGDPPARVEPFLEPAGIIERRVVAASGEPLADLRVERHWIDRGARMRAADTDWEGRFNMVRGGYGWLLVPAPAGVVRFPVSTLSLVVPTLERLVVAVRGEDAARVSYTWLHRGEWLPIKPDVLHGESKRVARVLLRADVPGRIPRLLAYPPPESTVTLDFRADETHRLRIVDGGEPVAGATVEVVDASPPPLASPAPWYVPPSGVRLNSVVADDHGRVSLAGNPDALYIAYVYAPGYEPARTRWFPGETELDLVPRNVEVRFSGLGEGVRLRVKVSGRDSLVALRRVDSDPIVLKLVPGTYDATVEDRDGAVLRGRTVQVSPVTQVADMRRDARPRVTVHLPDSMDSGEWFVSATRETPAGGTVARPVPGYPVPVAIVEADPDGATCVLALPGSGRWQVHAYAGWELGIGLFTEVDLEAGERLELELPRLDASLEGSVTYKLDTGGYTPRHGIAGPRMMLLSVPGAGHGWNVVAGALAAPSPSDDGERPFALAQVPAGRYHLFHHLRDGDAWGGFEVSLKEGTTTRTGVLGARDAESWTVEVVGRDGLPVTGAILRIRDRMHEAWSTFVTHEASTAVYAANPIPPPPAARLRGGPVTFDAIRPGWLELEVDDPAGAVRRYLGKVEPGRTLRLVVDR